MVGLGIVVIAVLAHVYDKKSIAALSSPIAYAMDVMFNLGVVKAAADGHFVPFTSKTNPFLGAPFSADWNDFPISEDHLFFGIGLLAREVGPLTALNVAHLGFTGLAALTMYWVCRRLRLRWPAAFVSGALFALSPFLFYRSVHHFTLVNYWHVPLVVLLVLRLLAHRTIEFHSRVFGFGLVVAVLLGIYNVYFLSFGLQMLSFCVLAQAIQKRWKPAAVTVVLMACSMIAFSAVNVDSVLNRIRRGPNLEAARRSPAEASIYALRPFELFVPTNRHRVSALARAGASYPSTVPLSGEFPSPYLGVVGCLGFVVLMFWTVCGALLAYRAGFARLGMMALWLIFFSIDGGGVRVFQTVTGLVLFRSNNRVSIFLLCFSLLAAAKFLSLLAQKIPTWATMLACGFLLVAGVYDQTPDTSRGDPNWPLWESVSQRNLAALADEKLVAQFEQRVPAYTQVFQMPPWPFPEGGFPGRAADYDHLRPYLFSKTLRYSYGNMKGRPESQWQFQMAAKNTPDMVQELERIGFGGLYVLKNAYTPDQISQLIAALKSLGRDEILESEHGDSFFVVLKPQPR
jgi:phosphoglycerol transferase